MPEIVVRERQRGAHRPHERDGEEQNEAPGRGYNGEVGQRGGTERGSARALDARCVAHPRYSSDMRHRDKQLIVVGDRVLVQLEDGDERTKVGLYLPPTAVDNQAVQGGRIVATGPGLPLPDLGSATDDEPWKFGGPSSRETRFVPMQARTGDYALFFRKAAVEITFESERYLVVPQAAVLALVRDDAQDDPHEPDVERLFD